jgi:hypothetical protein
MTMHFPQSPILLIDVDGVISLFGGLQTAPAGDRTLVPALVDGIPHFLSKRAALQLARLALVFECVWCTGWEERAEEHLPRLLDLPGGWPHLRFSEFPVLDAHWKLPAIDAHVGASRPVAWVDDAHDSRCAQWAAERPGPTLLITTDPGLGLTDLEASRLLEWAGSLRISE